MKKCPYLETECDSDAPTCEQCTLYIQVKLQETRGYTFVKKIGEQMKIGDKVRVRDCGSCSYHYHEVGGTGTIIRLDKEKSFPVKLDNGNCYLEKCLEIVE
jgi:hypothetical protein